MLEHGWQMAPADSY